MISTSCSESPFAVRLEVCRIDGGVLVMPRDQEGSGLHGGVCSWHEARERWVSARSEGIAKTEMGCVKSRVADEGNAVGKVG